MGKSQTYLTPATLTSSEVENDRGTPSVNLSFTHMSTCTHKCTYLHAKIEDAR